MRKLLLSLSVLAVFALGLGASFLVLSPGAGAHGLVDGTFNGSVGSSATPNAYVIALDTPATVAPGSYAFNITDYATIHNFDLCKGTHCTGTNSVDKTTIAGTGSVQWLVNLTPGTYTYQCDQHSPIMNGQFVVSGGTTTTATTSTTPALTVKIASVVAKRKLVTVTAKANQATHFTAALLKSGKVLTTTSLAGTSAIVKLKPVPALKTGYYVVQVKATTGATSAIARKKIYVY